MDHSKLAQEAQAFDQHVDERIRQGFVPDLRRLRKVEWFYNNVWREPEFVEIYWLPKVEFVLDIAKSSGGKVLEIGCGYGYLSLELARSGLDVTGIDLSPKSIEVAKRFAKENPYIKGFGSLEYVCADINSMDIGEEKYDSIVFFGTLHHMEDLTGVIDKVHRGLRQNGNLIISEPIRDNFTRESAEFAAILRAVLPTWVPYEQKLEGIANSEAWRQYVDQIYNEYTYQDEHVQSPCDNSIASEQAILNAIGDKFEVNVRKYSSAFIDRLIGGLRGEDRFRLARFLKFLDDELVQRDLLPPTGISIHATKL